MIQQASDSSHFTADAEVRYLHGMALHLQILERDLQGRPQGGQGHAQAAFDELVHRFDLVHAVMVQRGFLPLPK